MRLWLNLFRRSRAEYFADFFITPPITLVLLAVSIWHGFGLIWCLKFAAGALAWTFYEYATHRFVLHRLWLFRQIHALHHARQRDYIAVHPGVTLAVYALLAVIFGVGSSAVTAGFSVAYICYAILHTAFHYAAIERGHWLYRLKTRHAAHHRAEVNFGVSTAIWDRLFKTEANQET